MIRRIVVILTSTLFALGILFTSVMKASSVNYAFSGTVTGVNKDKSQTSKTQESFSYALPYPGSILPGNPLWPLKVLKDKLWFLVTFDPGKKAELSLFFADKRVTAARALFEDKKPNLGFSTLTKAEKYLEEAQILEASNRKNGLNTSSFLKLLAGASIKHREVIDQILAFAPEDAKPEVIKVQDYSKNVYKNSRDALNSKGIKVPKDPFND